jgi:hypothetical protein
MPINLIFILAAIAAVYYFGFTIKLEFRLSESAEKPFR